MHWGCNLLQANQTVNVVDVWICFCSGTAKEGGLITRSKPKAIFGYINSIRLIQR